jgi:hypothetical protein
MTRAKDIRSPRTWSRTNTRDLIFKYKNGIFVVISVIHG